MLAAGWPSFMIKRCSSCEGTPHLLAAIAYAALPGVRGLSHHWCREPTVPDVGLLAQRSSFFVSKWKETSLDGFLKWAGEPDSALSS